MWKQEKAEWLNDMFVPPSSKKTKTKNKSEKKNMYWMCDKNPSIWRKVWINALNIIIMISNQHSLLRGLINVNYTLKSVFKVFHEKVNNSQGNLIPLFKWRTAEKLKFSIKDFCSKCAQIRRKLPILVTFTEGVLNGKLHFLCSDGFLNLINVSNPWTLPYLLL